MAGSCPYNVYAQRTAESRPRIWRFCSSPSTLVRGETREADSSANPTVCTAPLHARLSPNIGELAGTVVAHGHDDRPLEVLERRARTDQPVDVPPFRNDPAEWQRTDWRLLQNGFVHLFWSQEVLENTVKALSDDGYQVVALDGSDWSSAEDALSAIGESFEFPDYYGRNLDALGDCLGDVATFEYGADPQSTGTGLVLRHFDGFAESHADIAHALLDVFARCALMGALIGHRMLCLVQSDDPTIAFAPVGSMSVIWNPAETLNARRGT